MEKRIINCRIVTPTGITEGDIYIKDGTIAAVGSGCPETVETYDAAGALVFPGFIDGLTTLSGDELSRGTAFALAGGVTTVVDCAVPEGSESLKETFARWKTGMEGGVCNYAVHLPVGCWNENTDTEIYELQNDGACCFLADLTARDGISDGDLYRLFKSVDEAGGVLSCRCGSGSITKAMEDAYEEEGRTEPYWFAKSRPELCETEAVVKACMIAEMAGSPVNLLNISTVRSLGEITRARGKSKGVFAGTCPQYLLLDEMRYSDPEGAMLLCNPPFRSGRDRAMLWGAIGGGQLMTVSSDHFGWTAAQRDSEDFRSLPVGLPGTGMLPGLVWSRGVAENKFSPERMCGLLCENPARLFGLLPGKGVLAEGADADIVIWDESWECDDDAEKPDFSAYGFTPYMGIGLSGRPRAVFLGGELAAEDGRVLRFGDGKFVPERDPQVR
ncbi:MAG TPA: amidohydrolase family protein [Oscillospiraceae bacterium]|nr:amidohydrolase family protein [Oscillospiraceae bacterium]